MSGSKLRYVVVLVLVGIVGLLVLGLIGSFAFSFDQVGEDAVAVETHWGEATGTVYESGQFWEGNPWLFGGYSHSTDRLNVEPITMNVEVQDAVSRDGQAIGAAVSVTYQLDSDQALSFYTDSETSGPFTGGVEMWEERVGERAITTAIENGVSSISALDIVREFDASDGGTDVQFIRNELRDEVDTQLRQENEELSPEIDIIEVRIEPIQLSDELKNGLEEIAVERTEAERQIVDAEADANAERERAEGAADATATRAEGKAEAFQSLLESYGGVDSALQAEWIEAINEDEGTIVLDSEAAPILDLNNLDSGGNTTTTEQTP